MPALKFCLQSMERISGRFVETNQLIIATMSKFSTRIDHVQTHSNKLKNSYLWRWNAFHIMAYERQHFEVCKFRRCNIEGSWWLTKYTNKWWPSLLYDDRDSRLKSFCHCFLTYYHSKFWPTASWQPSSYCCPMPFPPRVEALSLFLSLPPNQLPPQELMSIGGPKWDSL